MKKLAAILALSLLTALPSFNIAAHAQQAKSTTAPRIDESQYAFIQSAIVKPDPEAVEVARKLLSKVLDETKDAPPPVYAQFLSFPGYPEKSFLMVTLQGETMCGAMGCSTWIYLMTTGGEARIVFEDTVNGIGFRKAPVAGQPLDMVVQKRMDEPLKRWTLTRNGFTPTL